MNETEDCLEENPLKKVVIIVMVISAIFALASIQVHINGNPKVEPGELMKAYGDRVVNVSVIGGSYIITSRDGRIVKTRDFREYEWIQR